MEEFPDNDPEVGASTYVHQIGVKQHDCDVNSTTNINSDDALPNVGTGLKEPIENCSWWSILKSRVA